MRLEYLEDDQSPTPRVLLMYGDKPDDAAALRDAIAPLVDSEVGGRIEVESLPGFHGVDGCSLMAEVGASNLGVRPVEGRERAFRCVLNTAGWWQAAGLLEPFAADEPQATHEIHQYLATDGPILWIISTSRHW